jgi:hypothetical protein
VATALISTLAAGLIGTFRWRTWWSIGFAFAVPIFVGLQVRRAWALAVAVAYFAASSWPLVRAYSAFAGRTITSGAFTWILAAVLVAMPLTVAWTQNGTAAAWRMPTLWLPAFYRRLASSVGRLQSPRQEFFSPERLGWPYRGHRRAWASSFGKTADPDRYRRCLRSLQLVFEAGSAAAGVGSGPNESCSRTQIRGRGRVDRFRHHPENHLRLPRSRDHSSGNRHKPLDGSN